MPLERIRTYPYPGNISDVNSIKDYLSRLYVALSEEATMRIRDFENLTISALNVTDFTITNSIDLDYATASRPVFTDSNKILKTPHPYIPVTFGGTGVGSLTDHGIMLGSGTSDVSVTSVGATGEVFYGQTGADPVWTNSPTLTGLTIVNTITEFSTDVTLGGNSDSALPTEKAVKAYVTSSIGAVDHSIYSLTDGTRDFSGVVVGIFPTGGSHLATKEYVDLSINIEQDYFFTDVPHAISGIYYQMIDSPTGEPENPFVSNPLGGGPDQPLVNWATNAGVPGVTALPGGVFGCHMHASKSGNRSVNLYYEVWKRTEEPGGAETRLLKSEVSGPITTKAPFELHGSIATATDLNSTDILVIKWFANVGASGNPTTITLYAEGTSDSHLKVPVESSIFNNIYIRQDGTLPLTANWDIGNYTLTANELAIDGTFTDGTLSIVGGSIQGMTGGIYSPTYLLFNSSGGVIRPGNSAGNEFTISAWDVNGGVLIDFITTTSNNVPTCAISTAVTQTEWDNAYGWGDHAGAGYAIGGGAEHDGFSDFVSNEHIDHSTITLTAGNGLSGGGTIANNRTFALDLNELTIEASIVAGDYLAMVDITDNGSGKVLFSVLESTISHDNIAGVHTGNHHAKTHSLASHSTEAHSELTGVGVDDHHAQSHEATHRSGQGDALSHDLLVGFVSAEHKSLPNTIAQVLSDHNKAAHDALDIHAATVATIAGLAPDTATTQASQPNITSLGTLTGLVLDSGATIGVTGDTDLLTLTATLLSVAGNINLGTGNGLQWGDGGEVIYGVNASDSIIMRTEGVDTIFFSKAAIYSDWNNTTDLGSTSKRFKDGWFGGALACGPLTVTDTATFTVSYNNPTMEIDTSASSLTICPNGPGVNFFEGVTSGSNPRVVIKGYSTSDAGTRQGSLWVDNAGLFNITAQNGEITFNNDNLITTGTLSAGVTTVTGLICSGTIATPTSITMANAGWIGISNADERIIFDAAGKISIMGASVGIGNIPLKKLDIEGDLWLRGATGVEVDGEQIRFGRSDSDSRYHSIHTWHSNTAANNYMQFKIHKSTSTVAQLTVMTLLGSGNVGIGTSTPTNPLHVVGAIVSSNENLVNEASVFKLSMESTALGQLAVYGSDASTAGSLNIIMKSGDGSISNTAISIVANGNVGFGTSTPRGILDVAGITYVNPGTDTLSDAITAMSEGDCFVLGAGTYTQNDQIAIPAGINTISIMGQGPEISIISFNLSSDADGIITADVVTAGNRLHQALFQGFTVRQAKASTTKNAFKLFGGPNPNTINNPSLTFRDINIDDTDATHYWDTGVYLVNSYYAMFDNCHFRGKDIDTGTAVHLVSCVGTQFVGGEYREWEIGVDCEEDYATWVHGCEGITFHGTVVLACRYGAVLRKYALSCMFNNVTFDFIKYNAILETETGSASGGRHCIVGGFFAHDFASVADEAVIQLSQPASTVSGASIHGRDGRDSEGIEFGVFCDHSTANGNAITNCKVGMRVRTCDFVTVTGNTFRSGQATYDLYFHSGGNQHTITGNQGTKELEVNGDKCAVSGNHFTTKIDINGDWHSVTGNISDSSIDVAGGNSISSNNLEY